MGLQAVMTDATRHVTRRGAEASTRAATRAADVAVQNLTELTSHTAAPGAFAAARSRMQELAKALTATGNKADASMLADFAQRIGRAGELHGAGNTFAASQMLHSSQKLGLRNPEVRAALAKGRRADELLDVFSKGPAKPPTHVPSHPTPAKPTLAAPAAKPHNPTVKPAKPAIKPPVARPSAPEVKPAPHVARPLAGAGLSLQGLVDYLNSLWTALGLRRA